ncbi:nuclear transport factor 2 family protein [Acidisphaera sp. L21]|uniref:nuclear transport factor 2 family protein n=1 Tax=Acidisphaera sp. L21 TaxID=1641851 RepID=UPI00131BCB6A|nr:nuclear transport factor 2 family protein [Acidisphaera sp. L21]
MSHAKDDISELMARYCFALDDYALADLAALFTVDGVWQTQTATATGPAEIEALLRKVAPNPAAGAVQRHLNTSIVITLQGVDRAQARSYYTVIRPVDQVPTVSMVGDYQDEFVLTGSGWRFAKRVLVQSMRRGS